MGRLLNVVRAQQFSRELLEDIFARADNIRSTPKNYSTCLNGQVMATLFYEPSTRTRLSFEASMLRLGGSVIGTENAGEFSSSVKGESLEDTIRIVSAYSNVIVLRHKEEGSSEIAASISPVPLINAGDGRGQHPTQSLLDMYTLWREFGKIDGLRIAVVGDLANGRTVRSLAYLCAKFKDITLTFVSPQNLPIGQDIKLHLNENHLDYTEQEDLNRVLPDVDVVYMTRVQKERMDARNYELARGKYSINQTNFKLIRENARIMHPLPHVEEIQLPLDTEQHDPRVAYFRQAENGLYARMALLHHLLM
jgi:aspartate carbamoyltransferase catalytic subunit